MATERREIGLNERSPRPQTLFMCVQCAMGLLGYNLMAAICLAISLFRAFEFIFVLTNCLSRLSRGREEEGGEGTNKKVSSPVTFSPHSFVRSFVRSSVNAVVILSA